MLIKKICDAECTDIEVTVRYATEETAAGLISLLKSFDAKIRCCDESGERFVNASDIWYIETVDRKTFVYLEKSVLRTDKKLYRLAEELSPMGFVQVSKSCILNISFLESIKQLMNSRMEATLKGGEKIHINRKYINNIKQALKGECRT